MRVVFAPGSLKGTIDRFAVADALAEGWLMARPDDDLVVLPLADGGPGTVDVVAAALPGAVKRTRVVTNLVGAPVEATWLMLPDDTAVIELAQVVGPPLRWCGDPLGSHTTGLGVLLCAALEAGAHNIVVALGGETGIDGGTGALRALGARFTDAVGRRLAPGGGALVGLTTVDTSSLWAPPPGGVVCLAATGGPLLGPAGAAAVHGSRKGASLEEIALLEQGLTRLAQRMGGLPDVDGAGAAGGTGYGLATAWGAKVIPGARFAAELVGLPGRLHDADLVVTAEGRFDHTSTSGKVVGAVLDAAVDAGVPAALVAGRVDAPIPAVVGASVELETLAGSSNRPRADARRWVVHAGWELANLHRGLA